MEAAFGWIGDFLGWCVAWVPRIGLCRKNHGGVKWSFGRAKEIKPGLYWWCPIWSEVDTMPGARTTARLSPQTLTTKDGRAISVRAIIVYTVDDYLKAMVDSWDVTDTINDVGLLAQVEIISQTDFDDVRSQMATEMKKQITSRCRSELRTFGIKVEKAFMYECAEATTIRLIGDEVPAPQTEEE